MNAVLGLATPLLAGVHCSHGGQSATTVECRTICV